MLIIFEDITREQNTLHILIATLSATGVVCLALSLFGSLFMANRAMVPIQTAWQQQKDFLADASHELRTPLAIIQTNLEVVRENQTATVSSQDNWLRNIQEETACMTKLVKSLLFLAQADSRQQLLVRNDFSLNQMVTAAAEAFQPLAASQGITLNVSVEAGIRYYGDEAKIRQLIGILLDNAIRHTPPDGKIRVQLEQSKSAAALSVADSGEGISSEHLDKIFERFYQVDKSRAKGGAGLGLSIAKWIVESHRGTIRVASEPGAGTTFSVFLPLNGNQTNAAQFSNQ
ncbi:sensor histidine kinase [Acetonema longum]|uniref:histidine kinase n=1 Tax=Acetonema longum DSM 6540 TaxID=1009370 RepID=F7NN27_9FIRM|nr:ATP-binding protein [Acetonema longum]EGO62561.1 integral membrane sensor signal transduction histidine kinase [Acetonema longum DSM 6540]